MNPDKITLQVNRAIDILFLKQPTRTGLGVLLGVTFDGLLKLFHPYLSKISFIAIEMVTLWHLIPLGICCVYMTSLVQYIFSKPISDEPIDDVILLIKKGNFSETEKRRQYRLLIDRVLEKAIKSEDSKEQLVKQKE